MHDPMTVAHEVVLPIPVRRWRGNRTDPRWGVRRMRRTNPENLGEPVSPWWRPTGWRIFATGHRLGLYRAATIWHVEPGGRDSGEVCGHWVRGDRREFLLDRPWLIRLNPTLRLIPGDRTRKGEAAIVSTAWKWHVHHWQMQVHLEQKVRRFLLERCEECGRRFPWGYAPVSHQWDAPRSRWRDGVVRRAFHHECSSLVSLRQSASQDADAIRWLAEAYRVAEDLDHAQLLHRLKRHGSGADGRRWMTERIVRALGWVYDTESNSYQRSDESVSMEVAVNGLPGW